MKNSSAYAKLQHKYGGGRRRKWNTRDEKIAFLDQNLLESLYLMLQQTEYNSNMTMLSKEPLEEQLHPLHVWSGIEFRVAHTCLLRHK